ncbi:hypothetical protein TWF506_009422 [Arthrobotrys conoides]|uniref:Uncharacterized protein n=1 Tax=Arthrobotrys conoides TaxID=74498 RepID=A0AAN8NNI4_9PEZI
MHVGNNKKRSPLAPALVLVGCEKDKKLASFSDCHMLSAFSQSNIQNHLLNHTRSPRGFPSFTDNDIIRPWKRMVHGSKKDYDAGGKLQDLGDGLQTVEPRLQAAKVELRITKPTEIWAKGVDPSDPTFETTKLDQVYGAMGQPKRSLRGNGESRSKRIPRAAQIKAPKASRVRNKEGRGDNSPKRETRAFKQSRAPKNFKMAQLYSRRLGTVTLTELERSSREA